ncbi:MAG: NAD(P)/FAD-dependent oxidoreductase [Candidatus Lokiarchaeota archaeon]|nr:NAD(P)/FAD-dependent oxidoreductase [Candidatus Lokiarchaeota archaeon]
MKVIIVGNGVAGQTLAETIRRNNKEMDITLFTEESHPYYSRILLPHFVAGNRTLENLYVRKKEWYSDQSIRFINATKITKIDLGEKKISSAEGDSFPYDKLVLSVGSSPRKLDFGNPNVNLQGNFALRSISDAEQIQHYAKKKPVKRAFIVGGGLLGIELGFHLRKMVDQVQICEIAPYLLPRQLDRETSKILQTYLEDQGLQFILGDSVEKILGNNSLEAIRLQSGKEIETDMILQQLGIIPNTELAQESRLNSQKGIIVNEFMQTSDRDVYAAGDCIQFEDKIWGIIPASIEQAKQAAAHILNENPEPYTPSIWNTRLKVAGIDLTCIGLSSPEAEEGATLYEYRRQDTYTCRKVIIRDNVLTNAILLGPGADSKFFLKKAGKEVDPQEVKEKVKE